MDTAGHVLQATGGVFERAAASGSENANRPATYKIVGVILAICSGLFIGVSFVLKKKGLLKANVKYNQEAGEGYGYLKNVFWWAGMTLMIIGEICNFVAYAFVDAILVTPMGALSVVVTAILSAIFLKERLSFVGKIGCFNCIVGSVIIAINAPEQSSAANIQEMKHFVIAPGFLTYAGLVIIGCVFTAFWAGPRYGKKNMFVYLTICSMIGGLSVVATQGLGAAIVTQVAGTPQFNQWFLYVLLVFVVCTLVTEIIFLNKALNIFNAALVTPTYYVYFTTATIVTSAILFQGFKGTVTSIITLILGFLQICSGVVLLQLAKSSKDVPDTAIFKGDLDQVRTMAEQEEPESEPRADTLRGGAAIMRAISTRRTARQAEEVKTLHSETMEPIGEDEVVEWDGLRRRKTVLAPGSVGSLKRTKTIHPPLGHTSTVIDDDSEAESDDIHPGFFPRFGRRSTRKDNHTPSNRRTSPSPVPMTGIHISAPDKSDSTSNASREHVFGLPSGLTKDGAVDTSYHSPSSRGPSGSTTNTHVAWDADVEAHERASSRGSSLRPPRPPPHVHGPSGGNKDGTKRHFSFQNVFHRRKSDTTPSDEGTSPGITEPFRPDSRGAFSYSSLKPGSSRGGGGGGAVGGDTEEERLGLVKGDSRNPLTAYTEEPGEYVDGDDDEWQLAGGRSTSESESPVHVGRDGGVVAGRNARYNDDEGHDSDDLYGAPTRQSLA